MTSANGTFSHNERQTFSVDLEKNTWEVEISRIEIQDQPRQKVHETPSQPMAVSGGMCLSSQLF
jgi:hypothetical protein